MKLRQLVALVLLGLMVTWMVLPHDPPDRDPYDEAVQRPVIHALSADADQPAETDTLIVRVQRINEETFRERVSLRGRTRADRLVTVRAEIGGQVMETPVPRGAAVNRGDTLCQLAINGRDADLQEAVSREEQARMEYEGELDLQSRGLQGRVAIAQRKATLDAATAAVERARIALERTRIQAPFDGVMESRAVEAGDFLDPGGECATVLDDDPMLVIGEVPEHQIGKVQTGAAVEGRLLTGERISGTITYVSRAADPVTRSYSVEAELTPSDKVIRAGVTAEIQIASNEMQAHLVPPSALTLDDAGNPGLKTVNSDSVIEFHSVRIVGEQTTGMEEGLWVDGLPQQATVVTLGQELVFPGQTVRTEFSSLD